MTVGVLDWRCPCRTADNAVFLLWWKWCRLVFLVDWMSIFPHFIIFQQQIAPLRKNWKPQWGACATSCKRLSVHRRCFREYFYCSCVSYSPNIFTPVKPRQPSHIHLRNLFCLCGYPANLPLDWHQQKRAQSVFKFDLILHRLWLSYIYACHCSCSLTSILLKC